MLMEEGFKGFLTTKQASERTGMHHANIRRLLEYGRIEGEKVGPIWLVDAESLDWWAANRGWAKARRKKAREAKAKKIS
jgi:excisionase family DNA binding protein